MISFYYILVIAITCCQMTSSNPQEGQQSSNPQERLLILLNNPPRGDPLELIDLAVVKEFFNNRTMVRILVECFDITKVCASPGMQQLIDDLSDRFIPGKGCPSCPPSFDRIMTYSQNQFRRRYKDDWNDLIKLLPDVIG